MIKLGDLILASYSNIVIMDGAFEKTKDVIRRAKND